jgi:hypothetical protein
MMEPGELQIKSSAICLADPTTATAAGSHHGWLAAPCYVASFIKMRIRQRDDSSETFTIAG